MFINNSIPTKFDQDSRFYKTIMNCIKKNHKTQIGRYNNAICIKSKNNWMPFEQMLDLINCSLNEVGLILSR